MGDRTKLLPLGTRATSLIFHEEMKKVGQPHGFSNTSVRNNFGIPNDLVINADETFLPYQFTFSKSSPREESSYARRPDIIGGPDVEWGSLDRWDLPPLQVTASLSL